MPNNHPYDKKSDRRQQDLNDLVAGDVNFALGISSTVLSGIAAVSWITAWPGITAAG